MKKKTVKTVMVVAILLALSLYFIGGTYARYASDFSGEGSVDIAKWNIDLDDGSSETLDLTLTSTATDKVVANKIAPGSSATGSVELSFNGTEVAVEVVAEVNTSEFTSKVTELGLEAKDFTLVVTANGSSISTASGTGTTGDPLVIKLPNKAAFSSESIVVTVTATWNNVDTRNEEHTEAGEEAGTLEIPVTLTVQQHI